MRLIPPVLTSHDLPAAELAALRLDGEVYPLVDGWCTIDSLEGSRHRAAAVRGTRSSRLIAELGTAAWIWGAVPDVPEVLEFCVDIDARTRPGLSRTVRVRELVLDPGDSVQWSDGAVTSAVRTAVDLARFRDTLAESERTAIMALAELGRFGLRECQELLDRRRNLPEKRRAKQRLAELLSPR
jgi:hypothetical protein